MRNPTRLYVLAQAVKDAVVAGYAAYITSGDLPDDMALPDRQYVAPGAPPHDCELLAVQVESTAAYTGDLGSGTTSPWLGSAGHAMQAATVAVHVVRGVPTLTEQGDPPSTDSEEDASALILTDALAVLGSIVAAQRDGDLPRCASVALLGWTAIQPNGGLGGGIVRIRLGLE